MRCPECNCELQEKSNFCRYCGADLKNIKEEQEDNKDNNGSKMSGDKTKFVKAYVGKNYDSFKTDKFNLGAFFLGPLYLFYRKMYIFAFVFIILSLFLGCVPLVPNLVLAFVINGLYIDQVETTVNNYIFNCKNLSDEEIMERLRKKGGTTVVAPIIYAVVVFIIFAIAVALFGLLVYLGSDENNDSIIDHDDIIDRDYSSSSKLVYDVPVGFDGRNSNIYSAVGEKHYCSIQMRDGKKPAHEGEEEYAKSVYSYGKADVSDKIINGKKWYYSIEKKGDSTYHRYISIVDDRAYFVDYIIRKDEDKFCSNSLDSFVNSLKFVDNGSIEA